MNLEKLNEILNYNFENKELLIEALTHSSFSYENKLYRNYERLEFLGDAVLQLIVSEYLVFKYKDFDEGMLSRYRAYFVSEEFISELAKQIELGNFIRLGKGELNSGGNDRPSILCDIFESIVAAMYLDGGYNEARRFIITIAADKIDEVIQQNIFTDYKSELQKLTQKIFESLPDYRVKDETGPEHDKTFIVDLYINDTYYCSGSGKSKKKAEQDAAKKAFLMLNEHKVDA
ncbi:ribonuclease III family protein [Calditerrivibrio sp.]|uniref:Ribonuclease 3 n=1 Tax=Calditerrivibrio nitroreducens TaxID=477976 RepID=A0A2J6WJZ7_9BACT|nr:MAG: ribonuclease III [Calditerrivibrio nitroreducens]